MGIGGLEALSCPFSTKFLRSTDLRFTTSPANAHTRCYRFGVLFRPLFFSIFAALYVCSNQPKSYKACYAATSTKVSS